MTAMPSAYFPSQDAIDELGDGHVHRAALAALGVLALQAAGRLLEGHLLRVAEGDLGEVLHPLLRLLPGHRDVLVQRCGGPTLLLGLISFHSGSPRSFSQSRELNLSSGSMRALTLDQLVEVGLVPIELRAVHAAEHHLIRPRSPGRRRTCPCRRSLSGVRDTMVGMPKGLVISLTFFIITTGPMTTQRSNFSFLSRSLKEIQSLLADRAVVRGHVDLVADRPGLVLHEQELLAPAAQDGGDLVPGLLQGLAPGAAPGRS